jgi:hypothetical protein
MPQDQLVIAIGLRDARDWLFGDNENMPRGLRPDILKRQHQLVFVYDCGRQFASDNPLEQGLAHGAVNLPPK